MGRVSPRFSRLFVAYRTRDEKKPGLDASIGRCPRTAMRGVKELERAGIVRVDGPVIEVARGGLSWTQRQGGRLPDGPGRANEYVEGHELSPDVPPPPRPAEGGWSETEEWLYRNMTERREKLGARGP